ncbi:dual specificity phosphatase, catalytic domain protein [Opisthorchis viverrini]|uniref:protein-tyrosine-phosphatase n=1 Tax=Opisthorchis viverrini TaxID=6198 RepID=A0A1S8WZM1_OPIVI|nr:dual specificity phosphatase, catalytic domain protein [Opisthorchis viverrini]
MAGRNKLTKKIDKGVRREIDTCLEAESLFGLSTVLLVQLMDESSLQSTVQLVDPGCLAERIRMDQSFILLDVRSFVDYNTNHITQAVNIGGNRGFRRKFLQLMVCSMFTILYAVLVFQVPIDVFIQRLMGLPHDTDALHATPVVVYDHCLDDLRNLSPDCFLHSVLVQLSKKFCSIFLLKGGFLTFHALYPELCWESPKRLAGEDVAEYHHSDCDLEHILASCEETVPSTALVSSSSVAESSDIFRSSASFTPMTATPQLTQSTHMSKSVKRASGIHSGYQKETSFPGLSSSDSPRPSPILPHLVLGSQLDALSAAVCHQYGITHVINVSVEGSAPPHIPVENFYRIAVNDNYTDRMRPYFEQAFQFIDQVKANRGRVLVHCSAGISRSPTLAIAYLMYTCRISLRKAYSIIKNGRATIAPNFNFLGQLVEFERELFPSSEPSSGEPHAVLSSLDVESTIPATLALVADKIDSPTASTPTTATCVRPIVRRPSFVVASRSSLSPKHSMMKKRDRPTYLSLEAPGCSTTSRTYLPGNNLDISPTEGKRSRVSCLTTFSRGSASLLPSPCTVLSRLELSSPSDVYSHSVVSAQQLAFPATSDHNCKRKPYDITTALFIHPSTSLDKLYFEPCSVSDYHHPRRDRLLRSVTSLPVPPRRPTLLAERRLSSQASAPTTPQSSSIDCPLLPIPRPLHPKNEATAFSRPTSTNPTIPLPVSFAHNESASLLTKQKAKVDSSSSTEAPGRVLSSTYCDIRPPGFTDTRSCSVDSLCRTSTRKLLFCSARSNSASGRGSRVSFSAPAGPTNTPISPFMTPNLRNSVSAGQDVSWSSLYPGATPLLTVRRARGPLRPTAFESCRQEQQQLFHQSSSSSSSNLSCSSTGPNPTHNGSHFNPYPVS